MNINFNTICNKLIKDVQFAFKAFKKDSGSKDFIADITIIFNVYYHGLKFLINVQTAIKNIAKSKI